MGSVRPADSTPATPRPMHVSATPDLGPYSLSIRFRRCLMVIPTQETVSQERILLVSAGACNEEAAYLQDKSCTTLLDPSFKTGRMGKLIQSQHTTKSQKAFRKPTPETAPIPEVKNPENLETNTQRKRGSSGWAIKGQS